MKGLAMDEIMYHYTDVDGFYGIISGQSIRMTQSDYLNDPYDSHLFITLVKEYLARNKTLVEDRINRLEKATPDQKVDIKKIYDRCDLISYMNYIHGHVSLYVLSLTKSDDDMTMWNHYGKGGMQLAFSVKDLLESLVQTFNPRCGDEFLADADVIYTDARSDIRDININNFSTFKLFDSNGIEETVFNKHQKIINRQSPWITDQLYGTNNLVTFIDSYLNSYIHSLHYLLSEVNGGISIESPEVEVCSKVFTNVLSLDNKLLWKHDLSLYMLMLSALIKNNTYEHEREHRIVYFQYTDDAKAIDKKYVVRHLEIGDFIRPYVEFANGNRDMLRNSLKGIKLSPYTRNLPINREIYLNTLRDFVGKYGFGPDIDITDSEHYYRW